MTHSTSSGQDSPESAKKYDHTAIEQKWQKEWEEKNLYKIEDKVEGKENFYQLVEFSYPSGDLHTGHWYAFAVPDIYARYKRMQGFNVLYPMGFDAFGLPAENAAIKLGADPKKWTYEQMDKMRVQLRSMGTVFDWAREVVTCDPAYYKWTQWMFNQFLKNDLVYRAVTKVNWCPKDQTILANEQVVDGKCERCGTEVTQRDQDQWMLRITKYADRLVDDLEELEWPHAIKEAQKNWIGRSEGAEIDFPIPGQPEHPIKIFTTRPDTIFGATFIGVSAGLAKAWLGMGWPASEDIQSYIAETLKEQSSVRDFKEKEKTGIYAGFNAINPANKEEIPVWITNYVLNDIGTGAIMAVPAHDERDAEFAQKYNLPVKYVVEPVFEQKSGDSALVEGMDIQYREVMSIAVRNPKNDTYLTISWKGMDMKGFVTGGIESGEDIELAARREVFEETGYKNLKLNFISPVNIHTKFYHRQKKVNRHARWTFVCFDLVDEVKETVSSEEQSLHDVVWVSETKLSNYFSFAESIYFADILNNQFEFLTKPGVLNNSSEFNGLNSAETKEKITEFVGGKMTKTYRLRDWGISRQRYWGTPIPIVYDPQGQAHPVPDEHLPWLLPTDVDHTPDGTAPLARSKELFERTEKIFGKGWRPEVETMDTFVDSSWYFYRYLDNKNNDAFASSEKLASWMPIDLYMGGAEHTTMHLLYSRFWVKALYDIGLVKDKEGYKVRRNRGLILAPDGNKMSKSKGNAINPDEIVARLGTDTVRMYLAFMGPYGVTTNYPWDPNGVVGVRRFLERVCKAQEKVVTNQAPTKIIHKVIKKIGEDIEEQKYNTAISQMMILLNCWDKQDKISMTEYKALLQLLAPFAPHITEELWHELGEKESIHLAPWPSFDPSKVVDEEVTIGVQINGKLRGEITVSRDESRESMEKLALDLPKIKEYIEGHVIEKIVVVPGRIINIVISS